MQQITLPKPRLASQQHPIIAGVVGGFYRFEAREDVLNLLYKISTEYIQAKEKEPVREDGSPVLKMWVRGFELTADEKAIGTRGNFARIWVEFLPTGYYTLKAEKISVPLERHPQKDRAKGHHPNWGNPTMRAVETGKTFSGIAEANALLEQLHIEYPAATIPSKNSLSILLYNAKAEGKSPIDKIVVKVKPLKEGGAKLVLQKKRAKAKKLPNKEPQKSEGKFTTMVIKKRGRKTS